MTIRIAKTDTQILATEYPDPEWVIPDCLPEGYTVLAGLPKLGKSVIGLQIAEAVASGGMLFGQKIEKGKVLYIAVEDTERRLKRRMNLNLHRGTGNLWFYNGWDYLDKGGLTLLEKELHKREYRVCILDTLFRMFSPAVRQNDSGQMAAIGDALSNLSKPGTGLVMALIGLDHHNKGAYFNEKGGNLGNLSGSISKAGAADTLWNVYRKRGENFMKVEITGRDVDEQDIDLVFDPLTKCYQLKDDVRDDSIQAQILRMMIVNVPCTAAEIAVSLGKQPTNISRELIELSNKGRIIQAGKKGQAPLYIKVQENAIDPLGFLQSNKK